MKASVIRMTTCRYMLHYTKRLLSSSSVRFSEHRLNDVPMRRTRNIGIIAHIDAGKTTTTERMLFYSGKTSRIGNVDEGDTITDYLPSERQRGITIQLAAITIPWNNNKINIIDTPGHADFTFEVIRSLRVLDGAVTILDGVAGVEAQTEKVWKQADALKIPKIAYVNKMDRPGAGFSRTVKEIVKKLQTRVVLLTVPYFVNSKENDPVLRGVIDVLNKKLLIWDENDPDGRTVKAVDCESDAQVHEILKKCRESIIETLGELDDSVIDSFLENDEDYMKIPQDILMKSIRELTISNDITPVFCGSSFRNIGVQPLMDGVVNFLPSPLDVQIPEIHSEKSNKIKNKGRREIVKEEIGVPTTMDSSKGLIVNKNPNLTVALAFKVMTHASRGVMTFFRVYSGKLFSNSQVINTRTGQKLHIKKLNIMYGDEPDTVQHISSGNIGVITGFEDEIITGDTLVSHGPVKKNFSETESNLKLLPIEIPPPLFNSSIEPFTAGDEAYMNKCIKTLIREDPSLAVSFDEELGQTVLGGMGELHLDIVRERLVNDMKAKVRLRDVAVAYKEGLFKPSHKSFTTANEESSISLTLEFDCIEGKALESDFAEEDGALIFDADNNIIIFPDSITPQHIKDAVDERRWKCEYSIEDLQEAIIQGCLTGLQVGGPNIGLSLHSTVIRVKAWDYEVDTTGGNLANLLGLGRKAVVDFVQQNSELFGILEPIMQTKVYVTTDTLGEVSHDLIHRCQAVITLIEDEGGESVESQNWADLQSETMYLPPDYTMDTSSGNTSDFRNKVTIIAETPLRELIGYLSKLRSMTQGRATFDMTFIGMRRANKTRQEVIQKSMSF